MRRNPPPEFTATLLVIGGAAVAAYLMNQPSVSDKLSFLQKFGPIDLDISAREGWLPGILTSWAAMESNWAKQLPKDANTHAESNNLFGIKAGPTWQKQKRPFVVTTTHEYQGTGDAETVQGAFRAYTDWRSSAEDLVTLLKTEKAYAGPLAALNRKDVTGFIAGITASPFSTASNYGQRILDRMKEVAAVQAA